MQHPLPSDKSPQALDVALSGGTIFNMMRRLFGSVIRASVLEAVAPMFADLKDGQLRLEGRMDRLEERVGGVEERINGVEARFEARFNGFEARFNGFEGQIEGLRQEFRELRKDVVQLKTDVAEVRVEVAALRGDVGVLRVEINSLKRDRDTADDLAHRVLRIEDHLFAKG